ncbi:restriction endonuclease [Streptomyces sp. NPDC048419]|uniref:restriction endonuclease n=1 Tax=Streptomyces sp. NPDC048419 TaxID=3365547 RepID=UPI003711E2EE
MEASYRADQRPGVFRDTAPHLGAVVTATDPFGRRWVIRCKHRRHGDADAAVGTLDLQILNGTTRPMHGADIAVPVAIGLVTTPAHAIADQQRLHLVDRRLLAAWATGPRPSSATCAPLPPRPR